MIFMCFQVDFLYARSGTLQIFSLLTYSLFFERMTREELRNVKRLPKMPWCLAVMRCKHFAWHSRWVRQVRWFTQPGKGLGRKRLLVIVSERIERYSQKLEWSRQELKVGWFVQWIQATCPTFPHRSPARQMGRWPYGHHRVAFERSPSCRPDHFIKLWNTLTFKFSSVSFQLGFHGCFMYVFCFQNLDWNTSRHVMTYQCIKTKTWFMFCCFYFAIIIFIMQKWLPGLSDYVRLRSCKYRGLIPPGSSELPQRC